jgi:hypothetical protein
VANTRPSINKRRREVARKERKAAKAERRAQRAAEHKARIPVTSGEDPDIAGIVPGPQPVPWEEFAPVDARVDEDEEEKEEA